MQLVVGAPEVRLVLFADNPGLGLVIAGILIALSIGIRIWLWRRRKRSRDATNAEKPKNWGQR